MSSHKGRWWVGASYAVTVTDVFDGDTLAIKWHTANATEAWPDRVRIARISAAEMRPRPTPEALAAKNALEYMLSAGAVTIIPRKAWPDPYGRVIADVRVAGIDIATALITGGWVQPYKGWLPNQPSRKTKGANPTSAIPKRKLITPPGTRLPGRTKRGSISTGTPTSIDTQPHHP